MEVRSLLSLKSKEVQTEQLQPIKGTPVEVPVPKNVIFNKITRLTGLKKLKQDYKD